MTKSLLPDLQSPGRVHQHKISISCLAKARVTFLYCHGFGGLSGFTLSGVLATMRVVSGGFWKVGLSYPFTSPSSSIRSLKTHTHTHPNTCQKRCFGWGSFLLCIQLVEVLKNPSLAHLLSCLIQAWYPCHCQHASPQAIPPFLVGGFAAAVSDFWLRGHVCR